MKKLNIDNFIEMLLIDQLVEESIPDKYTELAEKLSDEELF